MGVFWTRFRFRRGEGRGRRNSLDGISGRGTADLPGRKAVSRAPGCEEGGEAGCEAGTAQCGGEGGGDEKRMARMEVVGWVSRRRNPPLFVGAGYAERMRFAHLQG